MLLILSSTSTVQSQCPETDRHPVCTKLTLAMQDPKCWTLKLMKKLKQLLFYNPEKVLTYLYRNKLGLTLSWSVFGKLF